MAQCHLLGAHRDPLCPDAASGRAISRVASAYRLHRMVLRRFRGVFAQVSRVVLRRYRAGIAGIADIAGFSEVSRGFAGFAGFVPRGIARYLSQGITGSEWSQDLVY
jgi:hypothetical protein